MGGVPAGPSAPSVFDPGGAPVGLFDPSGAPVGVTGRARLTGEPAVVSVDGRRLTVVGWAGPWVYERSWDPAGRRRRARLQCRVADGRVLLLVLERGAWRVEGLHQ